MGPSALSLEVRASSPAQVARRSTELIERVPHPCGGLVFVTGELGDELPTLARLIADLQTGIPWLLAAGPGLLTTSGEVVGQSAATLLVWANGSPFTASLSPDDPSDLGSCLERELGPDLDCPCLLIMQDSGLTAGGLSLALSRFRSRCLFGAITSGRSLPHVVDHGHVDSGTGALMCFRGLSTPTLATSPASRLLTAPARVTRVKGPLLLEIDARPAIDFLQRAGARLTSPELILLAVVPDPRAVGRRGQPPMVLRMLRGVDPSRQALVLDEPIDVGSHVAIAVRDAGAAHANLEETLGDLKQRLAGAAPLFVLHFDAMARGRSLYGTGDVDSRMLRQRLGELPVAGLKSSLEIAPLTDTPMALTLTALFAVFTNPS